MHVAVPRVRAVSPQSHPLPRHGSSGAQRLFSDNFLGWNNGGTCGSIFNFKKTQEKWWVFSIFQLSPFLWPTVVLQFFASTQTARCQFSTTLPGCSHCSTGRCSSMCTFSVPSRKSEIVTFIHVRTRFLLRYHC